MHKINIKGMHCNHCEMLVAEELEAAGATNVAADCNSGVVTFKGNLEQAQIEQAIKQAGFSLE